MLVSALAKHTSTRPYQCQSVQPLLVPSGLQHHAQLEDLGILLWSGVPWVAVLLAGGGCREVIVVVLGIQLDMGVFGSHGEKKRRGDQDLDGGVVVGLIYFFGRRSGEYQIVSGKDLEPFEGQ